MAPPPRTPAFDAALLFALRPGARVWAIGAIHGELKHLKALHVRLGRAVEPGDQIVYLGGYLGFGRTIVETVNEMLLFRRAFVARLGVDIGDVVYLRGAQEEMWQKLLQLQFSVRPAEVLRWLIEHGMGATIAAYGGSTDEGFAAAEEGVMALTRWTGALRLAMRQHDGHTTLMSALKHAATSEHAKLLFVHAGVDPALPLMEQVDHFWWGCRAFEEMTQPFDGYRSVVRGHAAQPKGVELGRPVITLDTGCGRGGPLAAACFGPEGDLIQMLEG